MQKAEIILTKLNQKSKANKDYKFKRIYRNLYNIDFYLKAYSKICSKEGNMTRGTDGYTIDGFNLKRIIKIIEQIRHERYNPTPVRRKYIPKKNGKMRPLGIPSFRDKLVQEVLRQILEAIYEPIFSNNSHGFRTGRSCHTALMQAKCYKGTNWIIEGDITGFFDNINHSVLIDKLRRKIEDGRIIEIIRRFLKAGYMEHGIKRNTVTGTPQGGIISPILANIYLNELDNHMENLIRKNTKGKERRINNEYQRISYRYHKYKRKNDKEQAIKYHKERMKLPYRDQMDENFRRVRYVRYADDFIVCIFGPKTFARRIKQDIADFLKENLKLELNQEKTLITNPLKQKVRFLGYDLIKAKDDTHHSRINGHRIRAINGTLQLSVPSEIISDKIKTFTRKGKSIHVNNRIHLSIQNLIKLYNAEIRGLYNYYSLANNVSKQIYRFKYYHYFSLAKTIGIKEKLSVRKVIAKYGIEVRRKMGTGTRRIIGVKYGTENKELTYFNEPIKKNKFPLTYTNIYNEVPNQKYCEILYRLARGHCELCGKYGRKAELEIHHVRKLKDEIEKYKGMETPNWLKTMIRKHRKSLVLCYDCHNSLHRKI